MMRQLLLVTFLCLNIQIFAQNEYPEITNVSVNIDENNQIVTVNYDLSDAENETMEISFLVSNNNGESFLISTENATGDVGFPVMSGNDKNITWDASGQLTGAGDYQIKLIADDLFEIDIQSIVNQVDSNRLRANLEWIEGVRHRTANPSHLEAIKDSMEQRFIAANLETYRQGFDFENYTGQNIIGRLEGTTKCDTTYIIDGHFDTVDDSPGADDNGSAVAGVLEVLRVLAPYRFNKTLRFIGFDLEETGLNGSIAYVSNGIQTDETIEGVFNLEMIGYYSDEPNSQTFPPGFDVLYAEQYEIIEANEFRGDFITNVADANSVELQLAYDHAAAQYVPDLKVSSIVAPSSWPLITPDLGRSDHAFFWLSNIPALMLTDGSNSRNPHYHSPNDLIETLDFTFMTNVVKAVVGAVAEEAEIEHSTTVVADFSVVSSLNNTLDCGLRISPIPADEFIQLSFKNCPFEQLDIQVFDILGKSVLKQNIRPDFGAGVTLDLKDLEAGVYWLKVSDGAKSLSRKVVVH